ncbi:MAG: hypothetical protein R3C19_12240 [Planctomycetaceae bacterium]
MFRPGYIQVTAPGLPPWPKLWYDERNKRVLVTARLPTWRSVEWAARACALIWISIAVYAARWMWRFLLNDYQPGEAFMLSVFGTLILIIFLRPLVHASMRNFLARQIFSSRFTVWFRPDAIAFRSRLYDNGVILRRTWKGQPVQGRFELTTDTAAQELNDDWDVRKRIQGNSHLKTASILRMIVTTTNPHRDLALTSQPNFVRDIPLTEIDTSHAQRFTIVLSAAASLTSQPPKSKQRTSHGVDIDAPRTDPA